MPAAAVLGLLVAGLVVLGLVYLDDSIRSPADVQRYLELPLLGSVPRFRTSGATAAAASAARRHSEPEARSRDTENGSADQR